MRKIEYKKPQIMLKCNPDTAIVCCKPHFENADEISASSVDLSENNSDFISPAE